MNRGAILAKEIPKREAPQEIVEFYTDFLDIYRNEIQIFPKDRQVEPMVWGDISFALRTLDITPEKRNTWLMTLPPEVASVYETTTAALELKNLRPQPKTPVDRLKDDINAVTRIIRGARFKIGLKLLGR